MPPEKFRVANAVVKAESTLLSLLEGTSHLSYEEKTKVVDAIQVLNEILVGLLQKLREI